MGWSLTHLKTRNPELVESALLAAGKSLYLANRFESKCKFVLRIANLEKFVVENSNSTFSDAIASLAKDKLLGQTIEALKKFPIVSSVDVSTLEVARDARNFIAHEGAYFGALHVKENQMNEHMKKLRNYVGDLARGDDVVSRWVYEIEEKEFATGIMPNYEKMIDKWIFG
jgi:hypothetical protein